MPDEKPYTIHEAWDDRTKKRKPTLPSYDTWVKEQTPQNLKAVIADLTPDIDGAVEHFLGPQASPVLRQRAKLLAAKAVRTYDPKMGAALRTHVTSNLRALQRMAPAVTDPLAPPERFRRNQLEISKASELLKEQLHRDPTDEEIADLTKLPERRVTKVRSRMRARIPMSSQESEDDDDAPDIVGSEHTDYDTWTDAVYHDLGELDRLIMMHRTGYRNADVLSTTDIANKLNMSAPAVSQRARRIQQRLDSFYASPR
jgi:DNA-directed RNA polymerase specialized sigma subunit